VGDWKLMEFLEDGRLELYNLRDDVGETKNLVDQRSDKKRELHDRLIDWRKQISAPMPTPNDPKATATESPPKAKKGKGKKKKV
jgi:hypothetical protein